MAAGEVQVFNTLSEAIGDGRIDMDNDTLKLAIIDNGVTPAATNATPAWGATSGVDYDGNEVGTGGGYTAGGETLASVVWSTTAAVCKLDADNVVLAQDASGFTDGYWGIIYSDTAANKDAIAFVDMDGPVSEVAGQVTFAWNAGGILTLTVADTLT